MRPAWFGGAAAHAVLAVSEMQEADRRTIESGTPGIELMERAGAAVAEAIHRRWTPRPVSVLCGPGGNGGDGFVAARLLAAKGWPVRLGALAGTDLPGDAGHAARAWTGGTEGLAPSILEGAELVADALFGAGLSRELSPETAGLLECIRCPCVAVDMPSGIDGDTGAVRGGACRADLTVTFCRRKPGHLLMPGRDHCGELVVADIGIADETVAGLSPSVIHNEPGAWLERWPWPSPDAHKHARGHLVVAGGGVASSGAARLAAAAALRTGAGLVTCAVPPAALMVYAAHHTAVMNHPVDTADDLSELIADSRVTALVMGPGQGANRRTREFVLRALAAGKPLVLDADALTVFGDDREALFRNLHERCVLTPHEGEFARLFRRDGDRLSDVRRAAGEAGCTVLLKGPDTVIAEPGGAAAINGNATPFLATAGSGDVLAGVVGGLLAQGAGAPDAAAMGCWVHGEAGRRAGPGLVAEDLPGRVAGVLRRLHAGAP